MVYTDLANEAYKLFKKQINGVECNEKIIDSVKVETVEIITEEAAEKLGKVKGRYISITDNYSENRDRAGHEKLSKVLAECIKDLLPKQSQVTLIVGLGNNRMTPDALGPYTVENIMVTRHLLTMFPDMVDKRLNSVCAITPSVLGLTGIESADIVKAVCAKINPGCIIAVDSLAAAESDRIGDTIQLSDSGIAPGAGVGNRRKGLNRESIGVPVIALGIPVVVRMQNASGNKDMLVTAKNIDTIISDSAKIIAQGINFALHGDITSEQIADFMY